MGRVAILAAGLVFASCGGDSAAPRASMTLAATDPALWATLKSLTINLYRSGGAATCAGLIAKTTTVASVVGALEKGATVNTTSGATSQEAVLSGVSEGEKVIYVYGTDQANGQGATRAHGCTTQAVVRGRELAVTLSLAAY